MSIVVYPVNGVSYDADDVETYMCTRTSGVYAQTGHFEATCDGTGRTVTIGAGLAWIRDEDYTGKSVYMNEATTVTISESTTNPRYDRIVLRFYKTTSPKKAEIAVIAGTAKAKPTVPAIVRNSSYYDLGLYTVYVPANSDYVTQGNITSTLADSSVCGLMADAITDVTPANVQTQYENLLATYKSGYEELQKTYEEKIAAAESESGVVLSESTITSDEITTITAGGEATSEHRYLDASGLHQAWTAMSTTVGNLKTETDNTQTAVEALQNSAFTKLGTATIKSGAISGTTTYTSDDGFRDIILQFNCSYLNNTFFAVNDGDAQKTLVDVGNVSSKSTGYLHLRMLGQFCEVTLLPTAITFNSTSEYGAFANMLPRLLTVDSTCKLTKLVLSASGINYSPTGTIVVWGR